MCNLDGFLGMIWVNLSTQYFKLWIFSGGIWLFRITRGVFFWWETVLFHHSNSLHLCDNFTVGSFLISAVSCSTTTSTGGGRFCFCFLFCTAMSELPTQIPRFVFLFLFLKKELLLHNTQIQAKKGQIFDGILIMQEQSILKTV